MEEKKEITLGELIQSEPFQEELKKSIKKHFDAYDKAVAGRNVKRHPLHRPARWLFLDDDSGIQGREVSEHDNVP